MTESAHGTTTDPGMNDAQPISADDALANAGKPARLPRSPSVPNKNTVDPLQIAGAPPAGAGLDTQRRLADPNLQVISFKEKLDEAAKFVAQNAARLTPDQVGMLVSVLDDVAMDLDEGAGEYGPSFNLTKFINSMYRSVRLMERKLYQPGPNGMEAKLDSAAMQAVTNSMKNLMQTIERSHEKVRSWERSRLIEEAHMAAAMELPEPHKSQYIDTLRAKLEGSIAAMEAALPG